MNFDLLVSVIIEDPFYYVIALILLALASFNLGLLIGWIWLLTV